MVDYETELNTMVSGKNLMNSYKLYFLKTLLVNTSKDRRIFSFYEMASWMCTYSFSDVCALGGRIRPLDKLYDVAVLSINSEGLMQSSKLVEIYDALYNTENKVLRREIFALCNYVPYRLIAYLWQDQLKGKTDREKNQIIEKLSRSKGANAYSIFVINENPKRVEVFPEWADYIVNNRSRLVEWIDKKIAAFVWREEVS
ncbi:MAG: hypothetical protein NC489_42810 [Ruminococcus flavefaciens]|nr:hypothetical protein [Ruminococcus flavefaciens]